MTDVVFVMMTILFSMATIVNADGEGSLRMPKDLEGIEIEDKAGVQIPLDISLIDQDGRSITLAKYFSDQEALPAVLTIGYYGCPMLCTLVLNDLREALGKINIKPGEQFRIISVSIDERETPELARSKKAAYLTSLSVDKNADWWNFHVTKSSEAKRLADAVGFNYRYIKRDDQFAHGAGIFFVSPQGVLSRTLFGLDYNPRHVEFALQEASLGNIGSFIDRVILSCFHYDPDSHRYGVYILGVMRLGGILTILILGTVLLLYFRGERKRMKSLT